MDTGTGVEPGARHRARANTLWLRSWLWCEAAWADFLYLVLPADCVVCGANDHSLCPECASALRQQTAAPFQAEHNADALMGFGGNSLLTVFAAGEYRQALSQSILAFKNHSRTELGPHLARALARTLTQALAVEQSAVEPQAPDQQSQETEQVQQTQPNLLLVPVPSTGGGWRRRGYDPVALMIRALIREGRMPPGMELAQVLRIKTKLPWHRQHQKGLGRSARRRNVRNTMAIKRKAATVFRLAAKPNAYTVVLVDDVLTTGSTLREAAKTLESAGLTVLCAVVLAAAKAPSVSAEGVVEKGRAENIF